MLNLVLLYVVFVMSLSPQTAPQFAITLDGKVDPEEWKNASTHKLHQEGEVKIMTDAQYVYVGFRGAKLGWSHVYTLHGDTVEVLHASAALGSSRYVAGKDNKWAAVQSFNWELRDTSMSERAVSGRLEYLKKHGWVGSVVFMHPDRREQEYVISRALFNSPVMQVAALRASHPDTLQYWPAMLADATRASELVRGVTVDTLNFVPSQWAAIR
jgi:hypothetical protein